jgi:hypothetical protein
MFYRLFLNLLNYKRRQLQAQRARDAPTQPAASYGSIAGSEEEAKQELSEDEEDDSFLL